MNTLYAAAGLLLLSSTVTAQATRTVNPEFHPLDASASAQKRRLPLVHKAAGTPAPVRFESRAQIDADGQLHLNCEEVDASSDKAHDHDR